MSKIFICYSHKDERYLDLLLKHFNSNLLDVWSDKRIEGAEHWEDKIQKALDSCNCGVLLLSGNFFNSRFIKDIELKKLLQNQYEKNTFLLPVLAEDCNIDNYSWISKKEVLPKGFKALENIKKRNHNKEAVKIVKRVEELLKPIPKSSNTKDNVISHNYPDAIAVNNFPASNDDFFGREKYFDILDKAWNDEQVNILSFIAFGGIGKTSLVDNWLKRMKEMHYRGARNIFMWSFYSQGSEEDRQVTATEFLLEACKFFKIKKIPKNAYEQGRELADIISKQKALLVLDGLEPLQSSLEDIGEIKDNGLQVLLKRLSRQNNGLVIITSRIKLAFINNQYIPLEKLEDYEGAELLKSFELNGTNKELEKISNDFDGHALALKLLGSYTSVVLEKDIKRISEIESLRDDKTKTSKHATRMLNSYKKYLKNTIELDILKILGFFDRAISFEVIDVLKNKPLIENINDKLLDVSQIDWKYALNNLKKLHLISDGNKVLDTHPLVREYFSKYVIENYNKSYILCNSRLYGFFKNKSEKSVIYEDVLYNGIFAIHYGCKSFNEIDTYNNIYQKLIQKQGTGFLVHSKGDHESNIQILLNYFDRSFNKINKNIPSDIKHQIFGLVGFSLISVGKIEVGIKLLEINIKERVLRTKNHHGLIQNVDVLFMIYVYLGKFNKSEQLLNDYIIFEYNIKSNKEGYLLSLDKIYLEFLCGKWENIHQKLAELELHYARKLGNENYIFHSVMAYYYIKIYLYFNIDNDMIEKRIKLLINHSKKQNLISDLGYYYLILGNLKIKQNANKNLILNIFNKTINYIQNTHMLFHTIEALIGYADALRYCENFEKANEVLQEAYDLIIRSEAKLLLADWYIVAIKFALDEEKTEKANNYFLEAKKLSKELEKYFIFNEELKKLESNFNKVI